MFTPFTTTGIGSVPHRDLKRACNLILDTFDIPFWPQFPRRSFLEAMIPQYSEGMPFLRTDQERERIWIERDGSDDLNRFYETCSDSFTLSMSPERAAGFYEMTGMIKGKRFHSIKGQITGPLTFTLGLKDSNGRYIFFDEELREIALILLLAKARWQIEELKNYADHVIIFIDEPILSALGSSAYLGVSGEEAFRLLHETVRGIKEQGAIAGIHCCGKADWAMVIETKPDILNFDAYDYFDTIEIYHERLGEFLSSGGYLAWGIIPTTDAVRSEDVKTVHERLTKQFGSLASHLTEELLVSRLILTPSCGTGSLHEEEAEKVFALLSALKEMLLQTR